MKDWPHRRPGPPPPPSSRTRRGSSGAASPSRARRPSARRSLDYVKKAKRCTFSAEELEHVCQALLVLESRRLAKEYAELGRKKYPQWPYFPLALALSQWSDDPERLQPSRVQPLLEEADRLARALPNDNPHRERLLALIQPRLEAVEALNPFSRGFLDELFGFGEDDDDEDDDY